MTPKQVERLEKTLGRVAREQGLDQERLRRWVSFLALCGVLESAVEKGVIDIYYLKGGVAMELRFARAARTTKDFDLGLRGNRAERIRRLSEVLELSFDEFTFRLKPEQHEMELADTVRVEVAVEYKTRAWQTIEVDLGPGEAREVDLVTPAIEGVAEMGLPVTNQVRCLGINEQVAQKLHSCTGPQRRDRALRHSRYPRCRYARPTGPRARTRGDGANFRGEKYPSVSTGDEHSSGVAY
jgi:hypothetical protein